MNKRKGNKFENKVQKCINSGAFWFDKGDLKTKDFMIECKYTEKKGFRISTKLLKKLWNDALEVSKFPMLVIGIKDEDCSWTLKVDITREVK